MFKLEIQKEDENGDLNWTLRDSYPTFAAAVADAAHVFINDSSVIHTRITDSKGWVVA